MQHAEDNTVALHLHAIDDLLLEVLAHPSTNSRLQRCDSAVQAVLENLNAALAQALLPVCFIHLRDFR